MKKLNENENTVSFIKRLKSEGYKQKQAMLISLFSAAKISRIWNNKFYQIISPNDYTRDEFLENRKRILDTILQKKDIPGIGGLKEQDKLYIKLLKFCHASYDDVRNIYSDRTVSELRAAWGSTFAYSELLKFDSSLIHLDKEEYIDFLSYF